MRWRASGTELGWAEWGGGGRQIGHRKAVVLVIEVPYPLPGPDQPLPDILELAL